MREIKFRGLFQGIDGLEYWVYGYLVKQINGNWEITNGETSWTVDNVGQFTGLKDKNNKEIYDGDLLGELVKIDGKSIMSAIPVCWWDDEAAYAVDLSFTKNGSHLELLSQNYEGMEVIGNIYQNPKLLNQ